VWEYAFAGDPLAAYGTGSEGKGRNSPDGGSIRFFAVPVCTLRHIAAVERERRGADRGNTLGNTHRNSEEARRIQPCSSQRSTAACGRRHDGTLGATTLSSRNPAKRPVIRDGWAQPFARATKDRVPTVGDDPGSTLTAN
jgi:hypothetical protein